MCRGIGSPSESEYVVTNNVPIAIATSEIKIARSAGVHRCLRSMSLLQVGRIDTGRDGWWSNHASA
jgi:hypothetical protein